MHRTVVVGGPRVGKTTLSDMLASAVDIGAQHTDDLIGQPDPEAAILDWMAAPGPWVIEGVTAVRALRRWLRDNDEGAPCDRVFWSEQPKIEQTSAQETMAKGCATVWSQIEHELRERGVAIQRF